MARSGQGAGGPPQAVVAEGSGSPAARPVASAVPAAQRPPSRPRRARHTTGQGKKKAREAPAKKRDLGNHTSSGSLTYLAGNLNNRTAARNDHTARLGTEPTLNRSALKPLALACSPA
jgi:hypothetical protein